MAMTRRNAIISSLMALGGTPIHAKQNSSIGTITATASPIGIYINLDTINYLEVGKGKETVRIDAHEIWDALHAK